jgi:hypothetical protein
MTKGSLDSKAVLQQHRAPPAGRTLRFLAGLLLMVYVTPVYFRVPLRIFVSVMLLMLGLIGIFSLIHIFISRRIIAIGPHLGAFVAVGVLVALCVLSWPALAILGRGQGELAAVTFLGISLLIAGWRAAPGCELMAIPDLLFGKHTDMPCLIFSPLDWLERRLWRK